MRGHDHAHPPSERASEAVEAPLVALLEREQLPEGQPLRRLRLEAEERCKIIMPALDLLGRRYAAGGCSFPGSSSSPSIFAMVASSSFFPNGAARSRLRRHSLSGAS